MTKAAVFSLAAGMAFAQTVSLTVNTGSVLHKIDPKIYGQSLEFMGPSVNGCIWGEVVRNRSFEETLTSAGGAPLLGGVPTAARYWYAAGSGEASLNTNLPLNGRQSLRIIARDADSGIEQPGYAVRAGDALRGSLWLAGTGPGLVVRLLDGNRVLAEQTVGAPGTEWREFPLLLNPSGTSGNATLRILARPGSNVKLDQVTLMPDSYRANGGFRTDLTQAVAALHPPIIRWPGGPLIASFKWKDSIGPQSGRAGVSVKDEWEPLAFGIDEFLALARKVGAEPAIVIPVDLRNAAERASRLQDAVDLVAYCNAPPDSAWGKKRAQNGHPEPYRVKYWEIDSGPDVEAVGQFVAAMKKADPAIRIVVSCGERVALIRNAAHLLDYLSFPQYEYPETSATTAIRKSLEVEIAQSKNPKLKLFVPGWKAQMTDWRGGLYAGGILNAMERDAAVAMAAPALLLRHVTASSPDNALIHFDQRSWFAAPEYVVMKLYRDHFAPDLLEIKGSAGEVSATATRTADGQTIYVKLVNPGEREVSVEIALRGDFPLLAAGMQVVAPDSLAARNTLEQPTAVQAAEGKVERTGMTARVRLPRWSAAVVTLVR